MTNRGWIARLFWLVLMVWASTASAQNLKDNLKIGVVNLTRLVHESPQATQAKQHMAARFAQRKAKLEHKADVLNEDIDRLKKNGPNMSADARDKRQAAIRDRQRKLQLEQSEYNDDVSQAEQQEFDKMRSGLRKVINAYAKDHGYDLILGDSVLYAAGKVDVTDAILARLKKQR